MNTCPSRSGTLPATQPEVSSVELRDVDGALLLKVAKARADLLVRRGYGEWRRASNGRRFVCVFDFPSSSDGWLSKNGRTTRKMRVWDANGQAVSAPVITEHRDVITKN